MVYQQVHRIREFDPKTDLQSVIEVNRTCLPENYMPNFFLDIYRNCPKAFRVAEVNDQVVGYVMCRIEYGLSDFNKFKFARKGHIVSAAVLPQYRMMSIGSSLLMETLNELKRLGLPECYLEVRVTNLAGIRLYAKMGFRIIGRTSQYYHDGADAYLMAVKLSNLSRSHPE